MIISINSPRKGNGQTTLAILLASHLAEKHKKDVCLVDLNKYCPDVELSLSSSVISLGLDEFCMLDELGKDVDFVTQCVKPINPNFYITNFSTSIYSLNDRTTKKLIDLLNKDFPIVIVDCAGMNIESRIFMDHSDFVVMPVEQNINTIRILREHKTFYMQHKNKTIMVVNRHINAFSDIKAIYDLNQFNKDLTEIGLLYPIYTLPFSMQLYNDNNNNALMHFLANRSDIEFVNHLEEIAKAINGQIKPYQQPKRRKLVDVINAFVAGL